MATQPIDATAWFLQDLPQRYGVVYSACLVYADGRTGRIGVTSRSHRGVRHIPEQERTANGAVIATIAAVEEGARL